MVVKQLNIIIAFLCFCSYMYGQELKVSGAVKSLTDNEPLIGVSVSVKNTTNGTMTAIDGDYSLDNVSANSTLVFSYMGYKTNEIPINGKSTISANLTEDSHLLNEVVAVGYRTEREADLTGAVSVVDVKDMMSESGNNPIKNLLGRVP